VVHIVLCRRFDLNSKIYLSNERSLNNLQLKQCSSGPRTSHEDNIFAQSFCFVAWMVASGVVLVVNGFLAKNYGVSDSNRVV